MTPLDIFLIICVIILIVVLITKFSHLKSRITEVTNDYESQIIVMEDKHEHGLKSQMGSMKGEALETFLPLFPKYPYNLNDVHYFGKPFDFLILNGRANGKIQEIVFQEVKKDNKELSDFQKDLRECIEQKRVRFEEIHISQESEKFYIWEKPIRRVKKQYSEKDEFLGFRN